LYEAADEAGCPFGNRDDMNLDLVLSNGLHNGLLDGANYVRPEDFEVTHDGTLRAGKADATAQIIGSFQFFCKLRTAFSGKLLMPTQMAAQLLAARGHRRHA
jgi:hypothetical protein